jgi:hypothetical protein
VAALWLMALMGNWVMGWTIPSPGSVQPVAKIQPGETLPQRQRILAEWLKLEEPATPSVSPTVPPPRGEGQNSHRMG